MPEQLAEQIQFVLLRELWMVVGIEYKSCTSQRRKLKVALTLLFYFHFAIMTENVLWNKHAKSMPKSNAF